MMFKERERLQAEFWQLEPKLRLILCDLEVWSKERGEEITVTSLIRTDEEQKELFDSGATKSRTSVHQFGRGADLRLFQNENLNTLVDTYVNEKYPYGDGVHRTCIVHEGTARHVHLQMKA